MQSDNVPWPAGHKDYTCTPFLLDLPVSRIWTALRHQVLFQLSFRKAEGQACISHYCLLCNILYGMTKRTVISLQIRWEWITCEPSPSHVYISVWTSEEWNVHPHQCKDATLITIYKNKGDKLELGNRYGWCICQCKNCEFTEVNFHVRPCQEYTTVGLPTVSM